MTTPELTPDDISALSDYLLAMADDALILGHRNSEWCGHAPILEEDIAFANLALDEIGHAGVWYAIYADLNGQDKETYPDQLVYNRPATAYRSAPMMELSKGDWAFSMMRQYLYDAGESIRLDYLKKWTYAPIAEAAGKIRAEKIYHLRHSSAWVRRLGLGTEESHRRMQTALDELWPYAIQYAALASGETAILPDSKVIADAWQTVVTQQLQESGLAIPPAKSINVSRRSHTPHLAELLESLQTLTQQYPGVTW